MKVTIIHRYFWPDNAPYAQMLLKISSALAEANNSVDVITSQPSHNWESGQKVSSHEVVNKVNIRRLPLLPENGRRLFLRATNTFLFAAQVFFLLLFKRTDIVMIASTPPVIMAAVVRWASRLKKFKYIYHCQDIHPEAMASIDALNKGFIYKFLEKIDIKNVQYSLKTVVLSQDMKNTLLTRDNKLENIEIINNFIFETQKAKSKTNYLDQKKFNLLFAGNLGHFQNLELIVQAAKTLSHQHLINFIFLGDGVVKKKLETIAGTALNDTIYFKGKVSVNEALSYMHEANIGIISIAKGVINVAYPSKTMMYLSQGLPLLVLADESEMTNFVHSRGLGVAIDTDSVEALANTVLELYERRTEFENKRSLIETIASDEFGSKQILSTWQNMYESLKKYV